MTVLLQHVVRRFEHLNCGLVLTDGQREGI